jgi:hypothetical protein
MILMGYQHLLIFGAVCIAAFLLVTYMLPRLLLLVYKRAILKQGLGGGPIPVNTLYAEPQELLADPIHPPAGASKWATTGVNPDTLYVGGWLDLRKGPLVLHVPDFDGRYYSVQFTDPTTNLNFTYVGTRVIGTKAGDYLITGPRWKGAVPQGMKKITSPKNSVLVFGRVLVYNHSDLPTAYNLAKQIHLMPFNNSIQQK